MLMKAEFTAVIEPSPWGGYQASCPEVPGATGHGQTIAEAEERLKESIAMILGDRLDDMASDSNDDNYLASFIAD